jgi:hypothetical protein
MTKRVHFIDGNISATHLIDTLGTRPWVARERDSPPVAHDRLVALRHARELRRWAAAARAQRLKDKLKRGGVTERRGRFLVQYG